LLIVAAVCLAVYLVELLRQLLIFEKGKQSESKIQQPRDLHEEGHALGHRHFRLDALNIVVIEGVHACQLR
jgi:hypothetical protein